MTKTVGYKKTRGYDKKLEDMTKTGEYDKNCRI